MAPGSSMSRVPQWRCGTEGSGQYALGHGTAVVANSARRQDKAK